jgi:trans-2,3-dihydro-3-hydroxyanthranilate isomerase
MRKFRYHLVDVFTDRAFGGNPLAVFTNGRGLTGEQMQAIAKELNLSETTFVLPPEDSQNDFKVRIFTPAQELPMAGHPTIGTSFVLAHDHVIEYLSEEVSIRLEEGVGVIPVTIQFEERYPTLIRMRQPLPSFGPRLSEVNLIAEMLSLDPASIDTNYPVEVVSCGVPFLFVPLRDLQAARDIRFRAEIWTRLQQQIEALGVFVFTLEVENPDSTVHSRMFAPGAGILEDPATGGASGPLGSYLVKYGLLENSAGDQGGLLHIVSEQGIEIGRPSFIHIAIEQTSGEISAVYVGGQCYYMGEGFLELP